MIRALENAVLSTDLDCGDNHVLNPGKFVPVPSGFVDTNDSRMSDARNPSVGSVTDQSVYWDAGIEQSKLNLSDSIPTAWLGSTSTTAAQGNLSEFISNKNQVSGYAGLDSGSKLSIGSLPSTGPQSGTVTEVDLSIPPEFSVSGSPINGAGTLAISWANALASSALRGGSTPAAPKFDPTPLATGLIPSLAASKVTTGVFIVGLLPLAIGLGVGHAVGILTDPGDGTKGSTKDYYGRDMIWKSMNNPISYQPTCPNVQITFLSVYRGQNYITIFSPLKNSNLFIRTGGAGDYTPSKNPITVLVSPGVMVEAYASRDGYNNSVISQYVSPPITS